MKKLFHKIKGWITRFLQYWDLLVLLVQRDLKLKYRRSFLGYIWSVLNPLLSMAVMATVFTAMFKKKIPDFPVYLICGNILFSFMREATNKAMSSVIENASLLKKANVPKYIFTLSKITSCMVNFVLSLGALVIVMIATGVPFRWSNLMIIIPIIELYVFCVGLGMLLAAATVFFRDIKNIWSVVTLAWMYMTPIFWSLSSFYNENEKNKILASDAIGLFVRRFNPMYMYIQQFRSFILQNHDAWEVPTPELMVRGTIVALAFLIVGVLTFNLTQKKFILYI